MCDPITAGLLIGGAIASGGGGMMANSQNAAAGRHYNVQVAEQNALLNKEFGEKQKQIESNQNTQNTEYGTMTDMQKAAFDQQTALADQKSGVVQDAVSAPGNAFGGTNSTTFDNAVANREALFAAGAGAPKAYAPAPTGSDISDHILSAIAADQAAKRGATTAGVTTAQAKIGALQDTNQAQGQLFRNMDINMGDIARTSKNVSDTLTSQERLPQEQINQQNRVNNALLATPLFRGPEPFFNAPNTAIATSLSKAGNMAMMAGGSQAAGAGGYFGGSSAGGAGVIDPSAPIGAGMGGAESLSAGSNIWNQPIMPSS